MTRRDYSRMDFHQKATSLGTRRALARKPRCNCTICFCRRYSAGHSQSSSHLYFRRFERRVNFGGVEFDGMLCTGCGIGKHTKKLQEASA